MGLLRRVDSIVKPSRLSIRYCQGADFNGLSVVGQRAGLFRQLHRLSAIAQLRVRIGG